MPTPLSLTNGTTKVGRAIKGNLLEEADNGRIQNDGFSQCIAGECPKPLLCLSRKASALPANSQVGSRSFSVGSTILVQFALHRNTDTSFNPILLAQVPALANKKSCRSGSLFSEGISQSQLLMEDPALGTPAHGTSLGRNGGLQFQFKGRSRHVCTPPSCWPNQKPWTKYRGQPI